MEVCLTESAIERFRSEIKEMNQTKKKNISICRDGGRPCLPGLKTTMWTLLNGSNPLSSVCPGNVTHQAPVLFEGWIALSTG